MKKNGFDFSFHRNNQLSALIFDTVELCKQLKAMSSDQFIMTACTSVCLQLKWHGQVSVIDVAQCLQQQQQQQQP